MEEADGKLFWPSGEVSSSDPDVAKRNAFMTCQLLRALNEAAEYFKKRHCPGSSGNFQKTYTFFPANKYASS
jgi:hypothetical protein